MKFAITPCPNDTFSYRALIEGEIKSGLSFVFEDIETLNLKAERGEYPVTKLSFAAYLKLRDKYELLDAGAAMGMAAGPVLVGRAGMPFDASRRVIVPGLNTTAALLVKFYAGGQLDLRPMMFRGITGAILAGEADFGVLIHEGRFVFRSQGLELVEDLGAHWTRKTGLPVPLGCICVRRDFAARKAELEEKIRESIAAAFADPDKTFPFVKMHAQYLEDSVLKKHVYAFVNEYSKSIAGIREKVISCLEKC
ncbi:MAG: 1,4-dihydroxy-6-naphthoate synthase [Verrucomicrobia bacterium]|nr:MAG: 1,4-dihydroxy-6-naphthoate synthase [Verrucomicrobiota bacterium]